MTKEQLLAAIAAPGLYVVGARRELIVIETDADGVQHELKPASLRRDGVLPPDGWSDREDLIVVGPFGRLVPEPIDVVLHCPKCGLQHIDAPEPARYATASNTASVRKGFEMGGYELNPNRWDNPPHRSHLCAGCGHLWRPADVPTNGVAAVKTRGKNDSPIVSRSTERAGRDRAGMLLVSEAALRQIARAIEGLKRECGMDPESPQAIRNAQYMSLAYAVRKLGESHEG